MPICRKCSQAFPFQITVDGKRRNLCNRKYCLECSPFGSKNRRQLEKVGLHEVRHCEFCNRDFLYKRGKNHGGNICGSCRVNRRRFISRIKSIEYKGGACVCCGYNRCSDALHFHHIDPTSKDFQIGGNHCRSWESIRRELDKCVLLCANCHAEKHAELTAKDKRRREYGTDS